MTLATPPASGILAKIRTTSGREETVARVMISWAMDAVRVAPRLMMRSPTELKKVLYRIPWSHATRAEVDPARRSVLAWAVAAIVAEEMRALATPAQLENATAADADARTNPPGPDDLREAVRQRRAERLARTRPPLPSAPFVTPGGMT